MSDWDEAEHPRHPAGTDQGGEFRHKWEDRVAERMFGGAILRAAIDSGVAHEEEITHGHSGAFVHRVTYNNGVVAIRKGFGDTKNWQDLEPDHQADAEELAAALAYAIGVPVPRVIRTAPNEVVMQYVEGELGYRVIERRWRGDWGPYKEQKKKEPTPGDLRLGLLDQLIQNNDRENPANWLEGEDGDPIGIDHAGAFRHEGGSEWAHVPDNMLAGPYAAPYVIGFENPKWRGNPLTKADIAWLRQQVDGLRDRFEAAGRLDWWEAVSVRLDAIGAKAKGKEDVFRH